MYVYNFIKNLPWSLNDVGVENALPTISHHRLHLGVITEIGPQGIGHAIFALGQILQPHLSTGAPIELLDAWYPCIGLLEGQEAGGLSGMDAAFVRQVRVDSVDGITVDK